MIEEVAIEVKEAVAAPHIKLAENDPAMRGVSNIAEELRKLAAAAKAGRRQEMLECARNVSKLVVDLDKHMRDVANRCCDPRLTDNIFRTAQAMRNYGVQLKILTAVKASTKSSRDADDQIVSITRGLGSMCSE